MVITGKMVVEMVKKIAIMMSLVCMTEFMLPQLFSEPLLSLLRMGSLSAIPKVSQVLYTTIFEEIPETDVNNSPKNHGHSQPTTPMLHP